LSSEECGRVPAGSLEQGKLREQFGTDISDVVDGSFQPEAQDAPTGRRDGDEGALRSSMPLFDPLRSYEARVGESFDGPVDDRPGDPVDATERTARFEETGQGEPVGGPFADQPENHVLGE
jgi:hypothetical protein